MKTIRLLVLCGCFSLLSNSGFAELVAKYSFEGDTSEGGTWSGTTGNYVSGVVGMAAAFDGIDDLLDLGSVYAIGTDDVSIAFWARFENGPPDQQLLSTGVQGQTGLVAVTYANGESQLIRFVTQDIVAGSAVGDNLYAPDNYQQDEWIHIVVTRSGNTGSIFINGELENTENDLRAGDLGSGNWRLGFGHQGFYFEGAIDELMIFDHALTQSDVDDILMPSQGSAVLKIKEDPSKPGEVIAVGRGKVIEPPASVAVSFDATMSCSSGISSNQTCSVDAATPSIKATVGGVKMKCTYDAGETVPEARIRMRTKAPLFEGDTCSFSVTAHSGSTLILDAQTSGQLDE